MKEEDVSFCKLMEARYTIYYEKVLELLELTDSATVEKACILVSRGADFEQIKKRIDKGELHNY